MHLDVHLAGLIQQYGVWVYAILFAIIFCETGLVVTPILPGDSLLFAAGALAATGSMNPVWLFVLLSLAGILGHMVNYLIGSYVGPKVFQKKDVRFLKKEYLDRTHEFYEKYGGKTIIISRFMPIIRTFAPFVAGIGRMTYGRFMVYNVTGAIAWVASFVFLGYFVGNNHYVKKNFTIVIFAIIFISILPSVIEIIRHKRKK